MPDTVLALPPLADAARGDTLSVRVVVRAGGPLVLRSVSRPLGFPVVITRTSHPLELKRRGQPRTWLLADGGGG